MRTVLLAAVLIAASAAAHAQSPTARLPSQPQPSAGPAAPSTAGFDEVAARRKLEQQGYRDLRNVTPNDDGTFSAQAVRQNPPGVAGPRPDREVRVEIDASGNVRER
jgi:hypothetical protein